MYVSTGWKQEKTTLPNRKNVYHNNLVQILLQFTSEQLLYINKNRLHLDVKSKIPICLKGSL